MTVRCNLVKSAFNQVAPTRKACAKSQLGECHAQKLVALGECKHRTVTGMLRHSAADSSGQIQPSVALLSAFSNSLTRHSFIASSLLKVPLVDNLRFKFFATL